MQRAYRLKKNASFSYVYRKGQSYAHPLLVLEFVPAKGIKVGVSVSKKVGKSVVRNLAKRRIYESFARLIPEITGEYTYVVVARNAVFLSVNAAASANAIDANFFIAVNLMRKCKDMYMKTSRSKVVF